MDMPSELQSAIDDELASVSPRRLAVISSDLSERYRAGRGSQDGPLIQSREDIAAYTAFRLPATYAAVSSVMREIRERVAHMNPSSLLDVGAGPGTAMWAASEVWPGLGRVTLLERDAGMIELGKRLAKVSPLPVLSQASWQKADATCAWDADPHDIVTCTYVLGELPESEMLRLVERLWAVTLGILVLIEPGTMAGSARVRQARDRVLELGGKTIAPCPHDSICPLPDEDWCHFSQRVARSSLHRQVKGGELGYEDEKFSYVAMARAPSEPIGGRILRHPKIGKGHVKLELCTPDGLQKRVVTKKDKDLYREVRDLGWGSAITLSPRR